MIASGYFAIGFGFLLLVASLYETGAWALRKIAARRKT